MTSSTCCGQSKRSQPYDQAYKGLHTYSLAIGLEVHPPSIETILKMTPMGPDKVVFLDYYNKSVLVEWRVDMVELDMDLLFSQNTFLNDLEKGAKWRVAEIQVSELHSSSSDESFCFTDIYKRG